MLVYQRELTRTKLEKQTHKKQSNPKFVIVLIRLIFFGGGYISDKLTTQSPSVVLKNSKANLHIFFVQTFTTQLFVVSGVAI